MKEEFRIVVWAVAMKEEFRIVVRAVAMKKEFGIVVFQLYSCWEQAYKQ